MEDADKKLEELAKKYPSILKAEPADGEPVEFDENGFVAEQVKKIELHPEDLVLIMKYGKYVLADEGVELVFNEQGAGKEKFKIISVRPNGYVFITTKWAGKRVAVILLD